MSMEMSDREFMERATPEQDREQIRWASGYGRNKGWENVTPLWRQWLRSYRSSQAALGLRSDSAMGYATAMIGLLYGEPTGDALARCIIRHKARVAERRKGMAVDASTCEHKLEQFGEWRAELQQAVQVHGLYRCTRCGDVQESAMPVRYYDLHKRRKPQELADARAKAEAEREALIAMPHEQARAAFLEQERKREEHIAEVRRQLREERGDVQ